MTLVKTLASYRLFLIIACTLFAQSVFAQSARIMVVGDSVSSGWERPSYRMPLVNTLISESCDVDMVGGQSLTTRQFDNPSAYPGKHFPSFDSSLGQLAGAHWSPSLGDDTDHQAFPGIQTNELATGVGAVLSVGNYVGIEQPNYILLQTGVSDLDAALRDGMRSDQEINNWANETITEIRSIVDQSISAHQDSSSLKILIGNYIPNYTDHIDDNGQAAAEKAAKVLERKIGAFVETRKDNRVLLVDVAADYDDVTMLDENGNPNTIGENQIAGAFLTVLRGAGLCASSHPQLLVPSVGAVVYGDDINITWQDNGLNVESWRVYVGSTQSGNSSDYFDSGVQTNTNRSIVANGLPRDGSNVFITLEYKINGVSDITLSSVVSMDTEARSKTILPELYSPVADGNLSSSSATFRWKANSTNVVQWWLRVGSSLGGSQYHSSGRIEDSAQVTEYVTGLPSNGETVYATLFYKTPAGSWAKLQESYTASSGSSNSTTATVNGTAIVTPTSGSTLDGSTQSVVWDTDEAGISQWWLKAGSTAGASNYFDSGRLTNASQRSISISNLPVNGDVVYIRLYYKTKSGSWKSIQSNYSSGGSSNGSASSGGSTTESSSGSSSSNSEAADASLVFPSNGSTLSGSSQSFTWDTNSSNVQQWWVRVGSSSGAYNYFDSGRISNANQRSISVSSLPVNGSVVHVSLHFKPTSSPWKNVRYTFKAASSGTTSGSTSGSTSSNSSGVTALTSPAAGSVLSGSSQKFTWGTTESGIKEWWFRLGSSAGGSNYYDSGRLSNSAQRSVTANNIPTNGSTVHAMLQYKTSAGIWMQQRYTYKASTSSGSSSSGSTSSGSTSSGSTSSGSSQPPALNLSKVRWLHTDVSGWAESASMSSVTVNSSSVCLNYNKANSWPSKNIYNADLVGNAWVFIWNESDSVWYGATWEWLRPGQTCKSAKAVNADHIKKSPYTAASKWKPTKGETLYFMVSGLVRTGDRNVYARTKPVKVIWP